MDIDLLYQVPVDEFITKMNNVLPEGIKILEGLYPKDTKSISAILDLARYEIKCKTKRKITKEELSIMINLWLEKEEILITRLRKRKKSKITIEENIRVLIKEVQVISVDDYKIYIDALLSSSENGTLRPLDFIQALDRDNNLDIDIESVMLKRLGLYIEGMKEIYEPI